MDLIRHTKQKRPYLLFSSTGNHAQVASWLKGRRNFDIFLCHYADSSSPFEDKVEYLVYRKGGKFPNLHAVMQAFPEVFEEYEAIWVTDDDILAEASKINRLFNLHSRYALLVSQPSFDPLGKISLRVTAEQPKNVLRFTNFVEVTCPIISASTLKGFMKVYDPVLVGYGIDWWIMQFLSGTQNKVAVIDCIRVMNPHDRLKGGVREIDVLQSHEDRVRVFAEQKIKHGISSDKDGAYTVSTVRNLNIVAVTFRLLRQKVWDKLKRRIRWAIQKNA